MSWYELSYDHACAYKHAVIHVIHLGTYSILSCFLLYYVLRRIPDPQNCCISINIISDQQNFSCNDIRISPCSCNWSPIASLKHLVSIILQRAHFYKDIPVFTQSTLFLQKKINKHFNNYLSSFLKNVKYWVSIGHQVFLSGKVSMQLRSVRSWIVSARTMFRSITPSPSMLLNLKSQNVPSKIHHEEAVHLSSPLITTLKP